MVLRRRPRQLIKNTHTTPTHIASHFLSSRCLNGLVWKMLICVRTHTHTHFFRIVFSSSLKHLHLAELMNTHTHCHSAAATLALAHKSYKLYNQRKESKKKTTTAYRAYLHFNKLKCVSARKRQHILHLSNVLSFYVCVCDWAAVCCLQYEYYCCCSSSYARCTCIEVDDVHIILNDDYVCASSFDNW